MSTQDTEIADESMLERYEQERIANKLRGPVLKGISKVTSNRQLLRSLVPTKTKYKKKRYDLMKLGRDLNNIQVAEIFSQPEVMATASRLDLTPGLVFNVPRCCWNLNDQVDAESLWM